MDSEESQPPQEQPDLPDIPEPAPLPREHVTPDYHKQSHKLRGIIILVIILLLAGGGAYAYQKHSQSQKKAKAAQAAAALAAKPKVASQIAATTKSYTSPNFYLTFSYPANWTIIDTGGGQMMALSPPIQLKNSTGQAVTGQIGLLIRAKTPKLAEFNAGNAVAVFDSEKISYSKPTQNQRASTYLSFLQYVTTTSKGDNGLDGIYITSDNGYQKGQAVPLVDVSQEDPVISIIFDQCSDNSCNGKTTPLTIDPASWNDAAFSTPLKNLLESLSIT
jgi:hypothetical protein